MDQAQGALDRDSIHGRRMLRKRYAIHTSIASDVGAHCGTTSQ
jgi:hypothetical protein